MDGWMNSGVEVRRCGGVVGWWKGGREGWRGGGVEGWRGGGREGGKIHKRSPPLILYLAVFKLPASAVSCNAT